MLLSGNTADHDHRGLARFGGFGVFSARPSPGLAAPTPHGTPKGRVQRSQALSSPHAELGRRWLGSEKKRTRERRGDKIGNKSLPPLLDVFSRQRQATVFGVTLFLINLGAKVQADRWGVGGWKRRDGQTEQAGRQALLRRGKGTRYGWCSSRVV